MNYSKAHLLFISKWDYVLVVSLEGNEESIRNFSSWIHNHARGEDDDDKYKNYIKYNVIIMNRLIIKTFGWWIDKLKRLTTQKYEAESTSYQICNIV